MADWMAHHQYGIARAKQGRFDEAVAHLRTALALKPDWAEAQGDLGIVLLNQGKLEEAAACLRQAVTLKPDLVLAHNNLGVVLAKQNKRDEALASFRKALALKPDLAAVHRNLAGVLERQGKLDEALASLRQAITLQPNYAEAYSSLGFVLSRQDKLSEARASLEKALALRPDLAEAHHYLGGVLAKQGQLDEALACLRTALRLKPDFAEAYSSLGGVLSNQEKLDEALAVLRKALQLKPDLAVTHYNLGIVFEKQRKLDEAIAHFHQATIHQPDFAEAYNNLGYSLWEQSHLAEAEASLRQALRLRPDFAEAHNNLGLALRDNNRLEEARASFQHALHLKPNYADAHSNLGSVAEFLGDLDAAAQCFREALGHQPGHLGALTALATMLRGKLPDAELGQLQERLAGPLLHQHQRIGLLFGLAQVLDARGEYGQAAAHLEEANALERARWRQRGMEFVPTEFGRFVDRLQQAFDRAFFDRVRSWGSASERPVFIFGLPRSGTTLLEQILASHSQVHGGGELHFTRDDFNALADMAGVPVVPPVTSDPAAARAAAGALRREQAFAALERLDRPALEQLAQRHLAWLEALNPSAARVTSKAPANWQFLGLLAALFPRAKFIHCRRDPRDLAVSLWMTRFQNLNWTCDPDHIAFRYHQYRRLMAHWRTCLPVPLLEIDYEETVANLEETARRLVSWVGLEWDAACLNFHQTRRPVCTASAAQVRQPLYKSSVGRWQHYATALGPLFSRLEGGA